MAYSQTLCIDSIPYQNTSHLPIKKGIDPQQVADLRAKGLTAVQIGKILNISKNTVFYHLNKIEPDEEQDNFFKDSRPSVFQSIQRRLLLSISSDDIKAMAVRDRVVSAGILYDKERLELGLATSINLEVTVDLSQYARKNKSLGVSLGVCQEGEVVNE